MNKKLFQFIIFLLCLQLSSFAQSDKTPAPFKPDSDPLGLKAFPHPPSSAKSTAEELAALGTWDNFNRVISAAIEQKTKEKYRLEGPKRQQMMTNSQKYLDGKPITSDDAPKPPFYKKAALKLKDMNKDGGINFRYKKASKDLEEYGKAIAAAGAEYGNKAQNLKKIYDKREGGGWDTDCNALIALQGQYLKDYNPRFDELLNDYLHQTRLKINEEAYWKQFMQSDADFAMTKLGYQLDWLSALSKTNLRATVGVEARDHCAPGKQTPR